MNGDAFDELTKQFAKPVSRRQAMKTFVVGGASGALALVAAPRADALSQAPGRCRKVKAICRQNYECCSFFCDPTTSRCACPPGSNACKRRGQVQCIRCFGGGTFDPDTCTCTCPEGKVQCGPFHCCPDRAERPDCCPSYYGGGYYCNYCYQYGGNYYCSC